MSNEVIVSKTNTNLEESALRETFESFGQIKKFKIHKNKKKAFITYLNHESVIKALAASTDYITTTKTKQTNQDFVKILNDIKLSILQTNELLRQQQLQIEEIQEDQQHIMVTQDFIMCKVKTISNRIFTNVHDDITSDLCKQQQSKTPITKTQEMATFRLNIAREWLEKVEHKNQIHSLCIALKNNELYNQFNIYYELSPFGSFMECNIYKNCVFKNENCLICFADCHDGNRILFYTYLILAITNWDAMDNDYFINVLSYLMDHDGRDIIETSGYAALESLIQKLNEADETIINTIPTTWAKVLGLDNDEQKEK